MSNSHENPLFLEHLAEYPSIAERYCELKRREPRDAAAICEFIATITERAELGRRFPIFITDYDPNWPIRYEEEAARLRALFGPDLIHRLEHFGSTAVPGLAAKPIVDILVEITSFESATAKIIPALEQCGYIYSWQGDPDSGHMALWKGYVPDVPLKYHLHMAPAGHPLMDRLLFRDYLRNHSETARDYEDLKRRLAADFPHDREEYTEAKGGFIRTITERAKASSQQALDAGDNIG
jgi:GrpB-like predicted nucleotidyltransferase (UPF0157 family)